MSAEKRQILIGLGGAAAVAVTVVVAMGIWYQRHPQTTVNGVDPYAAPRAATPASIWSPTVALLAEQATTNAQDIPARIYPWPRNPSVDFVGTVWPMQRAYAMVEASGRDGQAAHYLLAESLATGLATADPPARAFAYLLAAIVAAPDTEQFLAWLLTAPENRSFLLATCRAVQELDVHGLQLRAALLKILPSEELDPDQPRWISLALQHACRDDAEVRAALNAQQAIEAKRYSQRAAAQMADQKANAAALDPARTKGLVQPDPRYVQH